VKLYRILIHPGTAFATPLKGDTLFGQCCWAIRNLWGEARLIELLQGYTDNQPFLVISDPVPEGFLARPAAPPHLLGLDTENPRERKQIKARRWLPEDVLTKPVGAWGQEALSEADMMDRLQLKGPFLRHENRTHNSLNRLTGTTGAGETGFAPYDRALTWYHPEVRLSVYAALDDDRYFTLKDLSEALVAIGQQGYGKEASSGLGKFEVLDAAPYDDPPRPAAPNAWLTLAPSAPQGQQWKAERCYYETFTRFGRHGDRAVLGGKPFKNPVLMADSFAILTPAIFEPSARITGRGIGGVSKAIGTAVHQGYAPVFGVQWEEAQ
jgi:CRISPR-associated protein Csm4